MPSPLDWKKLKEYAGAKITNIIQDERNRNSFAKYAYQVILIMNKCANFVSHKKYNNYIYRNFSKFNFKTGLNFSGWIFIMLFLNLVASL